MAWLGEGALFEVNALVWVLAWSRRLGRDVTLATLPSEAWDAVCHPGIDAVWLMGVWQRSPAGAALLATAEGRTGDPEVVGSPYCIRRYDVDDRLGGRDGLRVARQQLVRRGCGLVLDFVP
ncbi:MAG TPA: hypothetical protein VD926_09105, partial [Acidimicrobiales bacterium]|nr:hypothetical protein [Acidimicrobiales bacterium]